MKISWFTISSPSRTEGYGESSLYISSYLKDYFDITHHNLTGKENFLQTNEIGILHQVNPKEADIIIWNSVPSLFSRQPGYNIVFTYWETNQPPNGWVDSINQADEFWTTSKWAKEMFIKSGVNIPVYSFDLGVNQDYYFQPAKPRELTSKGMTFLCIGSPSTRKNSQMSVDAFLKVFGDNERFNLIYKSNGPPDAKITSQWRPLSDHPRIKVIDWELSKQDLSNLYDQSDCVLYPTAGEGWGLLPIQGIAKGIPTICTNATACTEYANLSIPLDFNWGNKLMSGIYENCGTWAEPSFDDLCDKMLYVSNNYEEASTKTFYGADFVKENFGWDKVSSKYKERLCQISNIINKKL